MSTTEQSMYNDVFISYSRKDVEFTRRVVDAIYADGRDNIWVDWEDIEYAEDWWEKIQQGIDSAENFIFILTPDSARSEVCYDEVDYAVKSGKRIIPIMHIEITEEDFEKIHPAISQHNWLPFSKDDDFDAGMRELFKTLDTDLAHVRFHTRLQTRAREWENSEFNSAYLLSVGELDEANEWLASFAREEKIPLATDLQRRYVMASQVAVDENREREKRLEERARRNRLYLGAAIPSIIGLVITAIFAYQTFIALGVAVNARDEARTRELEAESALDEAVIQQQAAEAELAISDSISDATFASFWGRTGENPLLGLSYAVAANQVEEPPIEAQQTLAEIAWQPGARRQFAGHLGEVWGVAYSADGQYVFSGAGSFTGEPDNRLIQWDAVTGEIVRTFDEHTDRIYSVATSPDGRYVATGSQDTNIKVIDLETGEVVHTLGDGVQEHGVPIFSVRFTHDSSKLISGGSDRIIVWDVATGNIIDRFQQIHNDHILDMDISEDNQRVFSGSLDSTIRLWELDTGNIIHEMDAGQITGAKFLPGEEQGVTSDQDGNLIVWDLISGEIVRQIEYQVSALRGGVVVTPDGERFVSADENGNVIIWLVEGIGNIPLTTFAGHSSRINTIVLHPNGTDVATASLDYTVISWNVYGRDAEEKRYEVDGAGVYVATMSHSEEQIASGKSDGRIIVHNTAEGTTLNIDTDGGIVYDLEYSPDDTMLASAHEDGSIRLWDASTGEIMSRYDELRAPARVVTFSNTGNAIAAAGGQVQVSEDRPADNRIVIWNSDGDIIQELNGHQAAVRTLAFTPDGDTILSGSDDAQIIHWDVATGEILQTYDDHSDSVWSLSLNADGTQFLSGSRDTTIIQWDLESGALLNRFAKHETGVRAVAYQPDGIHAVSGAGNIDNTSNITDYELQYWNLDEGQVLWEMPGHEGTIRSLEFNTDGSRILSASDDGAVIVWFADTRESLLERVTQEYQIICLPDAIGCVDEVPVVASVEDVSVSAGFPVQTNTLEPYADDSACLLPDAGFAPVNGSVDTSMFAKEGPYRIGYSDGNMRGRPDEWILAWAEYEASLNSDLIAEFIPRNANGSPQQQVRDIRLLAEFGVDAIIVNPVEQVESNMVRLEEVIAEIVAGSETQAPIPVILVSNRTFEPVYTTYVGYDEYEVGCIMAQELTAILDGEGSIGVINGFDVSVADIAFKAGEQAVFEPYGGIVLTIEGPTSYSRDDATLLTGRQTVDGILGYTSNVTLGAQDGFAGQGADYAPFASGHSIRLARFALRNNIDGALIRRTTQIGAQAVRTTLAILQGDNVSQFVRLVPEIILTEDLELGQFDNTPDNAFIGDWEDLPEEFHPRGR